jgi:hypothetical protein
LARSQPRPPRAANALAVDRRAPRCRRQATMRGGASPRSPTPSRRRAGREVLRAGPGALVPAVAAEAAHGGDGRARGRAAWERRVHAAVAPRRSSCCSRSCESTRRSRRRSCWRPLRRAPRLPTPSLRGRRAPWLDACAFAAAAGAPPPPREAGLEARERLRRAGWESRGSPSRDDG